MTFTAGRWRTAIAVSVGLIACAALPCLAVCTQDEDCDDGFDCTIDICDPKDPLGDPVTGCVIIPDDTVCDDSQACTTTDKCSPADHGANSVGCAYLANDALCDDMVDCTVDTCVVFLGCINAQDHDFCGNGDYCDGDEFCGPGLKGSDPTTGCMAGTSVDCDDGFSCTTGDFCDEITDSCVNTPDDTLCANVDFCDGDETCDPTGPGHDINGCVEGTPPCQATNQVCIEATHECVDCTNDLDCWDGVPCTEDRCDTLTHTCVHAPDDAVCANIDFCDGDETCDPNDPQSDQDGCVAGTPVECPDDGFSCTEEVCEEVFNQCFSLRNSALCANGDFCDGNEICNPDAPGSDPTTGCLAGTPVVCDDGIACTVDTCDETGDTCVFTPDDNLCDNGDFCDGAETCDPTHPSSNGLTGCLVGTEVVCDDGVSCTTDTCDEANDECVFSGECTVVGFRVDLVWDPNVNPILSSSIDEVLEIDLLAFADDPTDTIEVTAIGLVIGWEPDKLEILQTIDSAEPWTAAPRFPNDSTVDNLNDGVGDPPIGLPNNDGDAFFQVLSIPPPFGDGPVVIPAGGSIVVATFRFKVLVEGAMAEVSIPPTGGPNTCSQVFWGGPIADCDIKQDLDTINVCDGGCVIDGTCYAVGALNPANVCQECAPVQDQLGWTNLGDFTTCELGPCELNEGCQSGVCISGGPPDCSSFGDQCNVASCDERGSEGNCDTVTVQTGKPCDDGMACNVDETCDAEGNCTGGIPMDCAPLDTECATFACDSLGDEGNCDDRTDAMNGTPCNGGLGECLDGICSSCRVPTVISGIASRYIEISPDTADAGTPIALAVENRCTLEVGWVALVQEDYDDGANGIVNVGVTKANCDDAEFHTPGEWLGSGNKLVVTGGLVAPQTKFDVVAVCGECAAPNFSDPPATTADCTWDFSDASNDRQVTFFLDLFKMATNTAGAGFPLWMGPDPGYEVDTQGNSPSVPDQQVTFLADMFSAFKATLAGGEDQWSGTICTAECPDP